MILRAIDFCTILAATHNKIYNTSILMKRTPIIYMPNDSMLILDYNTTLPDGLNKYQASHERLKGIYVTKRITPQLRHFF